MTSPRSQEIALAMTWNKHWAHTLLFTMTIPGTFPVWLFRQKANKAARSETGNWLSHIRRPGAEKYIKIYKIFQNSLSYIFYSMHKLNTMFCTNRPNFLTYNVCGVGMNWQMMQQWCKPFKCRMQKNNQRGMVEISNECVFISWLR